MVFRDKSCNLYLDAKIPITFALIGLGTPMIGYTDSALPGVQAQEAIEQQQRLFKQEQLRQQQALDALNPLRPPSATPEASTQYGVDQDSDIQNSESDQDQAPCATFNQIELEGATLLSAKQQLSLLAPYQGQCLTLQKLTQLQAKLTNHYIGEGFITTRVYFPKQDFSQGVLRVWVIEGKYQGLELLEREAASQKLNVGNNNTESDNTESDNTESDNTKSNNTENSNTETSTEKTNSDKTSSNKTSSNKTSAGKTNSDTQDDNKYALNTPTYKTRSGFNTLLPIKPGDILNLRDLEQAIDQINRLSAYDARMMLEPGDQEGHTQVKIYSEVTKPCSISTQINNQGSETLGKYQSTYSLRLEDTLGLYELWAFSYRRELQPNRFDRYGRSYSAYLSLPYRYWTLDLSTSLYEYKTPVVGKVRDYSTSGNSRSHSISVQSVVHRDQFGKTRVFANLKHSDIRAYVEEHFVDVSSRKSTAWNLGVGHSRRIWRSIVSAQLSYERGVPWWGAQADTDKDALAPKSQYSKISASASLYKPLALLSQRLSWQSQLQAQWSPDTLYNSERIGLGGQYSVRGFDRTSINGDSGFYWRNDVSWQLPWNDYGLSHRLFIGYDFGALVKDDRTSQATMKKEQGTLQGAALGYRLSHRFFSTEFQWEHGLQGTKDTPPDPWVFRFQASFNY